MLSAASRPQQIIATSASRCLCRSALSQRPRKVKPATRHVARVAPRIKTRPLFPAFGDFQRHLQQSQRFHFVTNPTSLDPVEASHHVSFPRTAVRKSCAYHLKGKNERGCHASTSNRFSKYVLICIPVLVPVCQ